MTRLASGPALSSLGGRGRWPTAALLLLLLVGALLSSGCATRLSRKSFIDLGHIQVDYVREVKGFSQVQPRGFDHPAIISEERMRHILSAIEIETREERGRILREPAFHPDIVDSTARQLVAALAEAGPDEEIGVKVIRKEMRVGILHRKYLTSFLAHAQGKYLRLQISRVEWQIPKNKEGDRLPEPRPGEAAMNFRVVSGEPLFYAGPQTLEIAWRDPKFRKPFRLPGTTAGQRRSREVLYQSDVPADEFGDEPSGAAEFDDLSPEQLRALADLEEDRRQGRITEPAYQRARRELLRKR